MNHRPEYSDEKIKQRVLNTWQGDDVLFNDREKPLTVIECPSMDKEWWVTFNPETISNHHYIDECFHARTREQLSLKQGESIDYQVGPWRPPYRVEQIEACDCERCSDLEYELVLEGPQGGEYTLKNTERGIVYFTTSADKPLRNGIKVYWFENQSKK